ncbi:MAG: sensor histidine kinase [Opitutales bacterium]
MEITRPLQLSIEEETLVDMHSVLNVMNVITYELLSISPALGHSARIEALIDQNSRAASLLREPGQAQTLVGEIDSFIAKFMHDLRGAAAAAGKEEDPNFLQSFANIESIFNILEIRAAEIEARLGDPMAWVRHDIHKLKKNFVNLFEAIKKNSKGGYSIVHNIAEHEAGDYFVSFEINSPSNQFVLMPAVFQDVIRDLIANGRKYTPPGGRIIAGLSENKERLRLVVSDTGIGIPPDEIEQVVQFEVRGSNVKGRPTRGGGFGLTKAYYVTRKFGGRLWIDSTGVPGEGTRVEITIPLPEVVNALRRQVFA